MDNLLLKIICTALILVLLTTICLGADGGGNKTYKQPATDPSPETPGETHISSDFGMRAEIKSQMDNSASSGSYIDSNPE